MQNTENGALEAADDNTAKDPDDAGSKSEDQAAEEEYIDVVSVDLLEENLDQLILQVYVYFAVKQW